MEIRASQRREPSRRPPPLHRKLARRRAWQQRLVYGGGAALAASLAAWLAGATLPLHLGAVALAFALGLGWRFRQTDRRAERWAFSWIEARSGLAYLSAHELPDTATDGLAGAVRAQAAQAAGTLDTPPLQPWALPLLVLALVFALAPHLALPTLRAPFGSGTASPDMRPTPGEARLEPDATTQDAVTTDTVSAPADGTPTIPNTTDSPDVVPDAERSFDTATGAVPDEAGGEQAALDRFLEKTEDAEVSPMQTQRGPSQSAAPTGQAQRSGEPGEPGQSDGTRPGTASLDAAPGADPSTEPGEDAATNPDGTPDPNAQNAAGEGEETKSGASSQEPESEGERAQQTGDPGQSDADEEGDVTTKGPEAPNEQPGTTESQRAEAASAESDRQNESQARTGEPTVQRGATSEDSEEVTQDIQDGQSSERGGNRGGADVAGSRERLGGSERAPERITGIRGEGPTTAGGEALQQGQTPSILPRTDTPGSYRRAAEEVIREGRIPLEYQELIRDYFR